uniref:Uncharacterized protein n=1 Tax=Rhizophora mucronata TaxID=61149 RepID=A0A2P2L2X5_RHIMU
MITTITQAGLTTIKDGVGLQSSSTKLLPNMVKVTLLATRFSPERSSFGYHSDDDLPGYAKRGKPGSYE